MRRIFQPCEDAVTLVITGHGLTIEQIVDVARHRQTVQVAESALQRIQQCREFIERKIRRGDVMYGVNTGVGELVEVVLSPDQLVQFQRNLIFSHSAGVGEPLAEEAVRAAMLTRLNVLAKGMSGCRVEVARQFADVLNAGITPVVCTRGSVSACGDLAPMAQVAMTLLGEGEAFFRGVRMPSRRALEQAGLKPLVLQARDGLAAINGSNLLAGYGSLLVYDAQRWLKQADIAAAMSLEALLANLQPYDARILEVRGFRGAIASGENIRRCMAGSDLETGRIKSRVQDAYSMRSAPQVIGAARDHLRWARQQFEIEINAVGDNPIFFASDETVLSGANFQGTPISVPLDGVGANLCMVCVLSERRVNRLLNPALSAGLPPFLVFGAGVNSGLMLSQYTADALIAEQRLLSAPASVGSIPAAADQEDFVSMGWITALKTQRILQNAQAVLGIEFFCAAQALDFRPFTPGKGTQAAKNAVREISPMVVEDRPIYLDHNRLADAVATGTVLHAVENTIGQLNAD